MATPRKATRKPINQPQPFQSTLAPSLPMSPSFDESAPTSTNLILGGSVVVLAILAGILAGLAIRAELSPASTVSPGPIAEVTNPQYQRILQGKSVASGGLQTIQVSEALAVQPVGTIGQLQLADGINRLQPGLSQYDAQGSVNGPAR